MTDFNSLKDYKRFIKNKKCIHIGEGSEGECFLSLKDSMVYKIFYDMDLANTLYDPKKIITNKDISLSSFAFPEELFSVNGKLCGYSTKYIKHDLFDPNVLLNGDFISQVDIDKLKQAYLNMKYDVLLLSELRVECYDMTYNLTFDGNNLVALDTLGYKKVNEIPLKSNMNQLDNSVYSALEFFLGFDGITMPPRKGMPLEKYLDKVKTKIEKSKTKIYE